MDLITVAVHALLEDLRDQVEDQSWRLLGGDADFMAHN